MKNIKKYTTLWWKWYVEAQPLWRSRTGIRPLLRKDAGKEGLASICIAGPSGLLQVVGSLYLWRKAFKDANPSKEYREAMEDFTWLLKEINGQLEAGTLVAKAASSSKV